MTDEFRPMTDDDILAVITAEEANAQAWSDERDAETSMALDYYFSKPLGDEEAGRSQVVSNDVCDVVEWLMPEFIRVFAGDDDLVEFEATGSDTKGAELATKYVRHIINVDNDGFTLIHDAAKDGLLSKIGCFKWMWVEKTEHIDRDYTDLDDMAMAMLLQDLHAKAGDMEVKIIAHSEETDASGQVTHDVTIRMVREWGQVEVCAVPPEQIRVTRGTAAINQSTRYFAHVYTKTRSELIAMGYPADKVMDLPAYDGNSIAGGITTARFAGTMNAVNSPVQNKMAEEVEYGEHFCLMDADGDGIAERMMVVKSGHEILRADPVSGLPFSAWSPVRMSHSAIGRSVADLVLDIQRIRTALLRGTMDNIYSVNAGGRKEVVKGQVNMDDLLTQRPGGVVRVKAPGMIRDMPVEFIGGQTMPLMDMIRAMRDERTGQMRHQQGVTAEGLHESTQAAMSMIESMQARTELMLRLYAEALKQMYAGVLDLVVRHQDKPRQVRIAGEVLNIDPAAFKERYGLRVKVGSGNASKDRKRADLEMILGKQASALPVGLSTPQHIYNTLKDIVSLTTQKDATRYFLDPASPQARQMAAQRKPQEDPLVLAEKVKGQVDMAKAEQQARFDAQDRMLDHAEWATEQTLKFGIPVPGSTV